MDEVLPTGDVAGNLFADSTTVPYQFRADRWSSAGDWGNPWGGGTVETGWFQTVPWGRGVEGRIIGPVMAGFAGCAASTPSSWDEDGEKLWSMCHETVTSSEISGIARRNDGQGLIQDISVGSARRFLQNRST
jgi:hypothetical protein